MSTEAEQVTLEATDTAGAIKDRIAGIRGRPVLLILPEGGTPLRRKLNLVLIQREAHRRAIQLALVSRDPTVKSKADELNISCFPTVAASENQRWKRGRQKVFLPRHHQPSGERQLEDLKSIASRVRHRRRHRPRLRIILERIFTIALFLCLVGAVIVIVLPGAVVVLTPRAEVISVNVDIVADASTDRVDIDKGIIQARVLSATVETTATVPTTGIRKLDETPARGIVAFTNRTDRPVTIPAGTILSARTAEPLLFRTVAAVTVPGGENQAATAPFEAMRQHWGAQGNVAARAIHIVIGPLADRVTVSNPAPATGGDSRTATVVAADDKASLLNITRGQLQSLGYEEMQTSLSESQVIVIESIRIEEERKDWTHYSSEVGLLADELTLTMRAVVSALVIDDRFSHQVALAGLRVQRPSDKTLIESATSCSRGPFSLGTSQNQVNFTVACRGKIVSRIDEGRLRESIVGMTLQEARQYLQYLPQLSESVSAIIEVFPKGLTRMPLLPGRIDLQVKRPA